jgi:hypothetical protein
VTSNESTPSVAQAILEWSLNLPMWQRDALRRIMTTADLSQPDEDQVFALAKTEYGLETSEEPAAPISLAAEHLPAQIDGADSVALLSIHDVAQVNALATEQVLTFGPEGLTVVYGENATGKSGYSRVLKRACRARDAEPVLPNVLAEAVGSAEAKFDLRVGDESATVIWRDDEVPPDVLSRIAIFDSTTSRVFVDEEDEVRFVPYGLDAFARLGKLCVRLKERLAAELGALQQGSQPLTLDGDTEASRLVAALDGKCCPVEAAVLAHLTAKELKELDDLRAAKLQDPAVRARTSRALATRFRNLAAKADTLAEVVSKEALAELRRLSDAARASSDAARLASEGEFQSESLKGIGSDAWRIMYEAAREFSEKYAYPDTPFPATDEGVVCVLCQQELAPKAAERMRRFEDFVADATARQAAADEKALQETAKVLKDADTRPEAADPTLVDDLRERDASLEESLVSELQSLRDIRDRCLSAILSADWEGIEAPAVKSAESLVSIAEALEEDADAAERSADPQEQARISARLAELEARKALGGQIPQVAGTIARKRAERDTARCMDSADTNAITRKGGELHKAAVTDALRARLRDELEALEVTHVPLEVADRGSAGKRLHRLTMPTAVQSIRDLSKVLSEGEHRAVAIAALLAECGLQGEGFPIVLDDPVCSLDHRYRERVAARLAKESQYRQVIVLTHDVFFLTELQNQADAQHVPITVRSMRRIGDAAGVCDDDWPWRTISVEQRLQWCDEERARLEKVLAEEGESEAYGSKVGNVVDRLRSTWERAVEDKIFNRVVTRFQNSVKVERLESVVFSDDDFAAVMAARDRLSAMTPAHDEAEGAVKPPPSPNDLKNEVDELRRFVTELKARQKAALKARNP